MTSDLAVNALRNALSLRGTVDTIVHSDRGSQFRSHAYVRAEWRLLDMRYRHRLHVAPGVKSGVSAFECHLPELVRDTAEDLRL